MGTALIRELHVYGQVAKINSTDETKTQHKGFGSRLMETAEKIATHYGYKKVSVIS
ncbi:GNAT family N-acetyltransferase [Patescibacteria group bacterium]|nr:GNAT family N-acetyltransferase [Patescibacteria group bacterium]